MNFKYRMYLWKRDHLIRTVSIELFDYIKFTFSFIYLVIKSDYVLIWNIINSKNDDLNDTSVFNKNFLSNHLN